MRRLGAKFPLFSVRTGQSLAFSNVHNHQEVIDLTSWRDRRKPKAKPEAGATYRTDLRKRRENSGEFKRKKGLAAGEKINKL